MQLEFMNVSGQIATLAHAVANCVFAETHAKSLRAVEALASMIYNAAHHDIQNVPKVISNANLFESAKMQPDVNTASREFQMCVRVATRMLHGNLVDSCNGATMFHHSDTIPDWAIARGYIADIDGLMFYA